MEMNIYFDGIISGYLKKNKKTKTKNKNLHCSELNHKDLSSGLLNIKQILKI
jgi:hypothetical protein